VQVVRISVQQTLFLDEVQEDHPIKDDLHIPLLCVTTVVRNSRYLLNEIGAEVLELFVELFDHLLCVVQRVVDRSRRTVLNRVELLQNGVLLSAVARELVFAERDLLVFDATVLLTFPAPHPRQESEVLKVIRSDKVRMPGTVIGLEISR